MQNGLMVMMVKKQFYLMISELISAVLPGYSDYWINIHSKYHTKVDLQNGVQNLFLSHVQEIMIKNLFK